ncbi:MAG: branched-chain amino acid ABC transporter permease [Lachnospiraceae bacterium]|nr:branched-chain amino acid ABC transporter permease [Lachnospiraceae bacterium]
MFHKITTAWALHGKPVTIATLVVLVAFPFLFSNQYFVTVAILGGVFAILAMSLNLISGFMGITSLGHAAFFGVGAYTAALLSTRCGWPFLLTLLAACVVSLIFGFLLGLPTLRLSGRYLTIVTLAFCEIIRTVETNWRSLTGGATGITGIPEAEIFGYVFDSPRKLYFLILVLCVLTYVLIARLMNSRLGRGITAVRDDYIAAQAMGIKDSRYKIMAFVISAALAGMAGGFYAHYMSFISPLSFSFDQSTLILSMIIIGGLGNLTGSVIGALLLTILPEVLRPLMVWRQVIYGALLVVVILGKPSGLLGNVNLKHIRQRELFRRQSPSAEGEVKP